MATVKLIIKPEKLDKQGLTLIQVQYQDNGKRVAFSTGEKIKPRSWDPVKRKVKSGTAGATELNSKLDKIVEDIKAIIRKAQIQDIIPTVEYVKEMYERFKNNKSGPTLLERFDEFMKERRKGVADSTLRGYRSTSELLKEFAEEKKCRVDFDTICKLP